MVGDEVRVNIVWDYLDCVGYIKGFEFFFKWVGKLLENLMRGVLWFDLSFNYFI